MSTSNCGCTSTTPVINLVTGDELPQLVIQLKNKVNGSPIDISPATTVVILRFREPGATKALFQATFDKIGDGSTGGAVLTWPVGALDIDPGRYEGEVSITIVGGLVQTVFDLILFNLRKRVEAP